MNAFELWQALIAERDLEVRDAIFHKALDNLSTFEIAQLAVDTVGVAVKHQQMIIETLSHLIPADEAAIESAGIRAAEQVEAEYTDQLFQRIVEPLEGDTGSAE